MTLERSCGSLGLYIPGFLKIKIRLALRCGAIPAGYSYTGGILGSGCVPNSVHFYCRIRLPVARDTVVNNTK